MSKDAKDWHNTFNLALYCLAAQYTQQADYFYRYALLKGASSEFISEAIQYLNDFLTVLPNHIQATSIRQLLQSGLTKSYNFQPTPKKTTSPNNKLLINSFSHSASSFE